MCRAAGGCTPIGMFALVCSIRFSSNYLPGWVGAACAAQCVSRMHAFDWLGSCHEPLAWFFGEYIGGVTALQSTHTGAGEGVACKSGNTMLCDAAGGSMYAHMRSMYAHHAQCTNGMLINGTFGQSYVRQAGGSDRLYSKALTHVAGAPATGVHSGMPAWPLNSACAGRQVAAHPAE